MAISKIETQIEFLGDSIATTSTAATEASAGTSLHYWVTIDPTLYDNVTGFYFETAAKISATGTGTAALYTSAGVAVTNGSLAVTATTTTLVRSAAITFPTTATTYYVKVNSSKSTVTATFTAFRMIIQQGTSATKRQLQHLIASSDSTTATTATVSGYSNRFLYTSSNFDGLVSIKVGATLVSSGAFNSIVAIKDVTTSTVVGTATVNGTTTAVAYSADITASLVSGHEYDVVMYGSGGTAYHGNAWIAITQANYTKTEVWFQPFDVQITGPSATGGVGAAQFDPTTQDMTLTWRAYVESFASSSSGSTTNGLSTDGTNYITNGSITATTTTRTRYRNALQVTLPGVATTYRLVVATSDVSNATRMICTLVAPATTGGPSVLGGMFLVFQ